MESRMKISTIELRKLTASEGMVLTNGTSFSSVGGDVYLGCNSSPDEWWEITEEEYNQKIKEIEKENEHRIGEVI